MGTKFQHMQVRRFKVDRFLFSDHILEIEDESEAEAFRDIVRQLSPFHQGSIREHSAESEAYRPKTIGPKVSKATSMTTGDLKGQESDSDGKVTPTTVKDSVTSNSVPNAVKKT